MYLITVEVALGARIRMFGHARTEMDLNGKRV
jgi:hypothetical protein